MQRLLMPRRALLATPLLALTGTARAQAQRIVCVGGALTETVYLLGAQARLVGVDTTSLFPAQAQKLPSVGYARQLSAEGLLALRPELVLASPEAGPPAVIAQLRQAGLRLEFLDAGYSIEGVAARTRRIGELLGLPDAGQRLAARIETESQVVLARVKARKRLAPRTLFVLAHSPGSLRLAGSNTAAHAMLQLAGARNAFDGVEGYKPLSAEAVLAARPDAIVSTAQGLQALGGASALLGLPGLSGTPAAQQGRLVAPDALLLLGFGPRLPQALQELAQGLGTL